MYMDNLFNSEKILLLFGIGMQDVWDTESHVQLATVFLVG